MSKLERDFQPKLIGKLRTLFPGCVIQKLDSGYQQGIPDLLILFEDLWAVLEVKRGPNFTPEPNQPWWVERLNSMSFAAFIYPENEEETLHALQESFRARRTARLSQREQVPLDELRRREACSDLPDRDGC